MLIRRVSIVSFLFLILSQTARADANVRDISKTFDEILKNSENCTQTDPEIPFTAKDTDNTDEYHSIYIEKYTKRLSYKHVHDNIIERIDIECAKGSMVLSEDDTILQNSICNSNIDECLLINKDLLSKLPTIRYLNQDKYRNSQPYSLRYYSGEQYYKTDSMINCYEDILNGIASTISIDTTLK